MPSKGLLNFKYFSEDEGIKFKAEALREETESEVDMFMEEIRRD